MSDEMPADPFQALALELVRFLGELLDIVLAEIPMAQTVKLFDQGSRLCLTDGDEAN